MERNRRTTAIVEDCIVLLLGNERPLQILAASLKLGVCKIYLLQSHRGLSS